MDTELKTAFANLAHLVETTGDSLQQEMHDMHQDLSSQITAIGKTTERNTRLLAGGSKTIAAITAWMRRQDAKEAKQDAEIRALRQAIKALKIERTKRA